MDFFFPKEWEQSLERQFLKDDNTRKCAYICSPLSAEAEDDFLLNMHRARIYMGYAQKFMNYRARAPHAYLPMLLCDNVADERALALAFGQRLLEKSSVVLVCGELISDGMRGEILLASSLHMPIFTFSKAAFSVVDKIITQHDGNKGQVLHDWQHPLLATNQPELFLERLVSEP